MIFDGYGRLQTRHRPEQSIGTATTYAYNADDTLSSSTDARGAVTSYGYNGRHLVTSVNSALSGSSTINVSYSYDAAGNRTSMSHAVGGAPKDSATYSYDQLSRMTSESVYLNALQNSAPNYGSYTIGYEYTLSNQLKKVTDPFNSPTEMAYDEIGRTKTVTGTWNGANYTYANNVSYRAWGAVKSISSGPTISYNNRMRPTHYGAYDYTYYDDGKLKEFRDVNDQVGNPQYVQFHYMSRRYSYDQAGRISSVGQLENYSILPPFSGAYGYDAFDNLTSRSGAYALNPSQSDSGSYTNNRRAGWTYNAEGKVTNSHDNSDSGGSSTRTWTYDAAGALIFTSEVRNGQTSTTALGYNGDGQLVSELLNGTTADYLIRSTVLGTVLTKLKANGGKDITYVPANGLVAPMQMQDQPFSTPASYMVWVSRDPLGIQENKNGFLYAIDPFGSLVANAQPPSGGPPPYMPVYGATYGGLTWNSFINANNFSTGCQLDGLAKPCSQVIFGAMNGFYEPKSGSLVPFGAVIEDWKPVPPGDQPPPGSRILGEFAFEPEYGFSGNLFPEPDPQNTGTEKKNNKPTCTLQVRGRHGASLGKGNPLRFPFGIKNLGATSNRFNWGWAVELKGTVSDDVSTWTFSQRVVDTSTFTYRSVLDGSLQTTSSTTTLTENLRPYQSQPSGSHTFFGLDVPGIRKDVYRAGLAVSGEVRMSFRSSLTKGDVTCEVNWSISVTVNNGVMTGATFH